MGYHSVSQEGALVLCVVRILRDEGRAVIIMGAVAQNLSLLLQADKKTFLNLFHLYLRKSDYI